MPNEHEQRMIYHATRRIVTPNNANEVSQLFRLYKQHQGLPEEKAARRVTAEIAKLKKAATTAIDILNQRPCKASRTLPPQGELESNRPRARSRACGQRTGGERRDSCEGLR